MDSSLTFYLVLGALLLGFIVLGMVSARIQWMMRAYAVIAGRMLFGSDIWELRNRYTLSVFNKKSIADIEVFNNIPGLRRVAVYKLVCRSVNT